MDNPDFTRLFVIDYQGEGACYNILDILHSEGGSELRTWSVTYPRILLRDDLERLVQKAGFEQLEFYGSFGLAPYEKETSQRLIAVAHR